MWPHGEGFSGFPFPFPAPPGSSSPHPLVINTLGGWQGSGPIPGCALILECALRSHPSGPCLRRAHESPLALLSGRGGQLGGQVPSKPERLLAVPGQGQAGVLCSSPTFTWDTEPWLRTSATLKPAWKRAQGTALVRSSLGNLEVGPLPGTSEKRGWAHGYPPPSPVLGALSGPCWDEDRPIRSFAIWLGEGGTPHTFSSLILTPDFQGTGD